MNNSRVGRTGTQRRKLGQKLLQTKYKTKANFTFAKPIWILNSLERNALYSAETSFFFYIIGLKLTMVYRNIIQTVKLGLGSIVA